MSDDTDHVPSNVASSEGDNCIKFSKLACVYCRDIRMKCDKVLPACTRCSERQIKCLYRPRKRRSDRKRHKKSRELDEKMAESLKEKIISHISTSLLNFETNIAPDEEDPEGILRSRIGAARADLPSNGLFEVLMATAGNHESSRPFDEESLFDFMNGSALLAFGLIADELINHAIRDDQEDAGPSTES